MAYINKEDTKLIRKALRKRFPEFKFSVQLDGYIAVNVAIMSGPTDFGISGLTEFGTDRYRGHQFNPKYPTAPKDQEILDEISLIINTAGSRPNFDRSDIMVDYFEVGYYIHLTLGKYNKPFILTSEEEACISN